MAPKAKTVSFKPKAQAFKDKSKPTDVRLSNIQAAKGKKIYNYSDKTPDHDIKCMEKYYLC